MRTEWMNFLSCKIITFQKSIYSHIRLTELIPELLDLVDEGRIAFRPAVELSYLQKEEQRALLEQIAYANVRRSEK